MGVRVVYDGVGWEGPIILRANLKSMASCQQDHHQIHEIISSLEKAEVAIVMVPLPMQSHLNQLLQLSALISSYGLPVHYVGSTTHNRQAKLRAMSGLKPEAMAKIHFHNFSIPPIHSSHPRPNAFGKFPMHLAPAILAYRNFRQPIGALVQELSVKTRRIVIIFDSFIAEAVGDVVSIPNAEFCAFNCLSAFDLFYILWQSMGRPFNVEGDINHLPSLKEFFPEQIIHLLVSNPEHFKQRAGDIHNTTRLIEGKYIDLLAREEISGNKKQWAIRPNLQVKFDDTKTRHKCLEWLDRQAPRSVIYVSFGAGISISSEEARELAMGLEQSKHKFIWVLRDADKADIFSGELATRIELPQGFEERVQENGMVVRDWAPQLEILAHKSTGGFMSHCGWNSCLESLTMGVPIAAWPMHSDQPLNSIFLTEILKIGMTVREWAQREELVKASVIKNVVGRLMASEEGDEIRKRAEEISTAMNKSMEEEGGECCKDLDTFIAHITRS